MKKNRQTLLAEKLIAPTLAFQFDMTEKEKKDFLKAMQTMFKLKIKQEIRPEEELMYTLTRQRHLCRNLYMCTEWIFPFWKPP